MQFQLCNPTDIRFGKGQIASLTQLVPADARVLLRHAITALHGTDHARTLTMIMPTLLRYKKQQKLAMLARYGRRVWKIDLPDDARVADLATTRTEDFMRQMGCPVRISEAGIALNSDELVAHLEQAKHTSLGENADIHPNDVRAILRMAA